jgi:hypothetical protein
VPEAALVAFDPDGVLDVGVPDELDEEPLEPDEPLSLDVPSFFEPPSDELPSVLADFESSPPDFFSSPPDFFGELP